jgi:hypothetical protein
MSMIIAHAGGGSLAEHHAFRRVVACKRMLSEMGYDPDTGIFDALRDLAALKGNKEAGATEAAVPSAAQQLQAAIALVRSEGLRCLSSDGEKTRLTGLLYKLGQRAAV